MAKFQESVNTLSDFPEAFALCQEEPWILRDVRSMPIENYRLFYHVDHDKREVFILRVFYYRPIVQQLADINTFKDFTLQAHTIRWPNGVDFAPEFIKSLQ